MATAGRPHGSVTARIAPTTLVRRGRVVGEVSAVREPERGRAPYASVVAMAARWRVHRRAGQREAEGQKAAASACTR